MPAWSLAVTGGIDPGGASAFLAGFGICEIGFAVVFSFLMTLHLLKRVLSAAGL